MSNINARIAIMAAAAMSAATAGCGTDEVDRPKTYPVSGVVSLNGVPIEGATVTFVPQGDGKSAVGFTDAAGKYTLTTFINGDGAVPGQFRVKISKYGQAAAPATAAASPGGDTTESAIPEDTGYAPPGENTAEAAGPASLLPLKYADPNTSGLMVEVIVGENPPRDFKLEG